MEMVIHNDKLETTTVYENVHDVKVSSDALKKRPGEDREVQASSSGEAEIL